MNSNRVSKIHHQSITHKTICPRGISNAISHNPSRSRCFNTISPPPSPNPLINLLPRKPIPNKTKRNAQLSLHIPVPRLIVKEKHILEFHPGDLMNSRKMLRLVCREYLNEIEVI